MAASSVAAAGGAIAVNMEMEMQQPHRKDARKASDKGKTSDIKGKTSDKGRPSKKDFQPLDQREIDENDDLMRGSDSLGVCVYLLMFFSYLALVFTFPVSIFMCLKVVAEYERAVIFRMGRLLPGGAKGPGIFFILPCIDNYVKVDLRTISFDVPPQEILSKDSVTVAVDAVVYYRVCNPTISITNVEDAQRSTRLLAATTLRNVLGTKTLGDMLIDRDIISSQMQSVLDEATDPWGVKVERVEIKDVRLPVQLQRAMAAEAEAAREARAKVVAAEGERNASRALKEAADVLAESPSALQLRYLQTLNTISAEKNSTIIFPLPIDLLTGFLGAGFKKSRSRSRSRSGSEEGSRSGSRRKRRELEIDEDIEGEPTTV